MHHQTMHVHLAHTCQFLCVVVQSIVQLLRASYLCMADSMLLQVQAVMPHNELPGYVSAGSMLDPPIVYPMCLPIFTTS